MFVSLRSSLREMSRRDRDVPQGQDFGNQEDSRNQNPPTFIEGLLIPVYRFPFPIYHLPFTIYRLLLLHSICQIIKNLFNVIYRHCQSYVGDKIIPRAFHAHDVDANYFALTVKNRPSEVAGVGNRAVHNEPFLGELISPIIVGLANFQINHFAESRGPAKTEWRSQNNDFIALSKFRRIAEFCRPSVINKIWIFESEQGDIQRAVITDDFRFLSFSNEME